LNDRDDQYHYQQQVDEIAAKSTDESEKPEKQYDD